MGEGTWMWTINDTSMVHQSPEDCRWGYHQFCSLSFSLRYANRSLHTIKIYTTINTIAFSLLIFKLEETSTWMCFAKSVVPDHIYEIYFLGFLQQELSSLRSKVGLISEYWWSTLWMMYFMPFHCVLLAPHFNKPLYVFREYYALVTWD